MSRAVATLAPLLLLAVEIQAPPAWACSCAIMTPAEWVDAEGSAWIGEIVAVVPADGCAGGEEGYRTATAEVVEAFVGTDVGAVHTVTVWVGSGQGGGADCSIPFPFEPGDRWLFYGEDPEINLCSGSGPVEERTAEIDTLRRTYGG